MKRIKFSDTGSLSSSRWIGTEYIVDSINWLVNYELDEDKSSYSLESYCTGLKFVM